VFVVDFTSEDDNVGFVRVSGEDAPGRLGIRSKFGSRWLTDAMPRLMEFSSSDGTLLEGKKQAGSCRKDNWDRGIRIERRPRGNGAIGGEREGRGVKVVGIWCGGEDLLAA